jgi:nucleoside 2-deoxyribosyltransferase
VSAPRVYLSGAIEHASDGGTGWRLAIGSFLTQELGHQVYDPAADEKKDLTEEERRGFRIWKRDAPERFRGVVRKIIAWDLDRIERETDYVVALWDEASARGGGTAAEITQAHRLGKPVYLVLGMPQAQASGWVLAAAEQVFEDFEKLRAYLREFDPLSPRDRARVRGELESP